MDKQKEIEEMAKYCCASCEMFFEEGAKACNADEYYGNCSICLNTAKSLYNAGYREAEDVRKETARDWCAFVRELIDNHNLSDHDYEDAVAQIQLKREEYGVEAGE